MATRYTAGYATDLSNEDDPVAAAFAGRYRLLVAAQEVSPYKPKPPVPRAGRKTA